MTIIIDSIKTGGMESVSGSIVVLNSDTSEIVFHRDSEKIKINISFSKKNDSRINITSTGGGPGNELCINVDAPLLSDVNQGLTTLLNIAKFDNGDLIYFHFWAKKLPHSYLFLNYSIYVREING